MKDKYQNTKSGIPAKRDKRKHKITGEKTKLNPWKLQLQLSAQIIIFTKQESFISRESPQNLNRRFLRPAFILINGHIWVYNQQNLSLTCSMTVFILCNLLQFYLPTHYHPSYLQNTVYAAHYKWIVFLL